MRDSKQRGIFPIEASAGSHLFSILFILLLPLTAACQTDTLTLEQAVALAIERNGNIASAVLDVKQSESRVRETKASFLPPLLFHSHYLHAPESGYNEIITNGGEYGIQAATNYPLYDGGIRSAQANQATTGQERSVINLDKSKGDIRFEVLSLYYEGVQAQEAINILEESIGRLTDFVEFLTRQKLGGTATESDVIKARVDLNNARIAADQARQMLQKNMIELQNITGSSFDRRLVLQALPADSFQDAAIPEFSLNRNADVQLLAHDTSSAGYDVTIARAERLPSLTVGADAGALGVAPNEIRNNIGYSVLITLDVPVFDWGAIGSRIEQKELARQQAQTRLENQRRDIEMQWRAAFTDLESQRRNLGNYRQNISEAEQNYLSTKSRFAGGSGSNLDVLDAQRLLNDVKLSYNNSLFQMRIDFATLYHLAGE